MFKYNRTTLTKLESILKQQDYTVRYERGNFKSGYCIVENRNVAVINKFFDVEARINILIEILGTFEVDLEKLDEASIEMYQKFMQLDTANSVRQEG